MKLLRQTLFVVILLFVEQSVAVWKNGEEL